MSVLRRVRQRLQEEWLPRLNLVLLRHAIGKGSMFLLAYVLVNMVCNRASNEEGNYSVLSIFFHGIPVAFVHYFPLTMATVIAWFIGHQFFIKKPGVLPIVVDPASHQGNGTGMPLDTMPLDPQGTGPPHLQVTVPPQGTDPLHPQVTVPPQGTGPPHPQATVPPLGTGPPHPQVTVPLQGTAPPHPQVRVPPQGTRPQHPQANGQQEFQGTRTLNPQGTGHGLHSQGSEPLHSWGTGGSHNQGSGPSQLQGTGTLDTQRIEASHSQADSGVVDNHLELLIYRLKQHIATESMLWGEGSSGNASLTINFKGVKVRDVQEMFQPRLKLSGSTILHKRLEIGPDTGFFELEEFRRQMVESMRRARILDPDCTLQLGSFAVVKYTENGHLKWWRLRRHWTPTIWSIRGSPRSLLNLLRGSSTKWTVRGSNLQTAILKASTSDESEILNVLSSHREMESGEDLLLCEEPHLVQNSAPLFSKAIYICATNVVEIEPGVTVNLQSEPQNIQKAYWMSVMDSLIPSPWTMIMTLSFAVLGGLNSGADETHEGLFPRLASRHLGLQGGDIIVLGVNLKEGSFLSHVVGKMYRSFLLYIFLIFILDLVVSLLRELFRAPVPLLGSDIADQERTPDLENNVTGPERIPDLEDITSSPERTPHVERINSSLSPASPPSIEDNLWEDISSPSHTTPSRLDETSVDFQAEGMFSEIATVYD